jgi:SAM-dependent methyltransferase
MNRAIGKYSWEDLYPDGVCHLCDSIKCVLLDQEMISLPKSVVSEDETRYPVDEASMRGFLETFFTRHLFQLQKSLMEYVASLDFQQAVRLGPLRILDIGCGPAVASLGMIDLVHRMMNKVDPCARICRRVVRMVHVLNDTSPICLATGKHMLAGWHEREGESDAKVPDNSVLTLPKAFPDNMCQVRRLASFLGVYDVVILSYVLNPLTDDYGLRTLAAAMKDVESLCRPRGRVLILRDKFQESRIQHLAQLLNVQHREQTLTQEIYPPRGENETYTYTYYDCLYAHRGRPVDRAQLMQ